MKFILAIGHARWSRLLLRLSTLPAGLGLKSVWLGCAARNNAASICSRRALWFWAAFGPGCLSWSIFSHLLSLSVPACWVTLRFSPFKAIVSSHIFPHWLRDHFFACVVVDAPVRQLCRRMHALTTCVRFSHCISSERHRMPHRRTSMPKAHSIAMRFWLCT